MSRIVYRWFTRLVLTLVVMICVPNVPAQQKMDRIAKEQVLSMLKNVKNAIIKNYYDPSYHGMNVEERFKAAEEKLKSTEYLGQAFAVIAQAVLDLEDSHTMFYPPARAAITEYGWRMKIYGDRAYITGVKDKSDADAKGLQVGDEVLKLNGFRPTRKDLWKMIYYYQALNPQTQLALEVRKPSGEIKQLNIESKVTQLKAVINLTDSIDFNEAAREGDKLASNYKHYFSDMGGALVWKMPDFAFPPLDVDGLYRERRTNRP